MILLLTGTFWLPFMGESYYSFLPETWEATLSVVGGWGADTQWILSDEALHIWLMPAIKPPNWRQKGACMTMNRFLPVSYYFLRLLLNSGGENTLYWYFHTRAPGWKLLQLWATREMTSPLANGRLAGPWQVRFRVRVHLLNEWLS